MELQEKGGSTYFFLALVTLAFLAAVLYLTFGANRTEQEGYTVQTERPAREEVAPERVLVNINTATAEELETVTGIGPVLAQAILDYRAEPETFRRSTSCWRCAASAARSSTPCAMKLRQEAMRRENFSGGRREAARQGHQIQP